VREVLGRLMPYLLRYRRGLALGIGALILRNVCAIAVPLLIREAVDSLTAGFSLTTAGWFSALLVAVSAVKGLFHFWMRVILIGISRDVEYDLRNDLFHHLMQLSAGFYGRSRTGDIMARATNDLNAVRQMLGPGVMYTADTLLTLALTVTVMAWFDWRLTLVALLPAPLVTVSVRYLGGYIHRRFKKIQTVFSDISNRVQENISGVRVVRAFVQEDAEEAQFDALNQTYVRENLRLAKASGLFMPMLQSLTSISFLLVLWYGGYRLLDGAITLGSFLMFNVFLGYLIWPMVAMGWVTNLIQRGTASLARIAELLDESPEIVSPESGGRSAAAAAGEIEFRDVAVRFGERPALGRIRLSISAGSTIAVVGPTGSGKSTLLHLIPRLFDPESGSVCLDGVDLREYDVGSLRHEIGFVPQETFLFGGTWAENIAFGAGEVSEEEVRRAGELAGLTDDVAGYPLGYETVLGERGITLSGGQKQRTAIARAILRNPRILVLDDALSSVDTVTEERILRALSTLMRERTTILVSHRVSTVRHADCIYVLENGSIAEYGNHEELLRAGKGYADLHRKQMLEDELEAI